jgi:hypothetical protein
VVDRLGTFFVLLYLWGRRNERMVERDWELLLTPDGLAKYHEMEAATQAALAEMDAAVLRDGRVVLSEAKLVELRAELRAALRGLKLTEAELAELCAEFRADGLELTEAELAELRACGRLFIRR